ncbi:F-box protein At1g11270 [Raphanus sativus]|uniref:F-box protein At1g11270 n=1 Tax=Raphanus sativus TaxID=3726 RepID=A0A6J0JZZ4_RAPSA|nr:F-box protein At1g11270 [Raphanus sativus]XP_018441018.1 F-box protein At1g11270 [Raphanus sativus]
MFPLKTRRTLKRHREDQLLLLPDDVVERILERLPIKSLLRFRTVSKKLKSAIDSRRFQERQQLIHMSRGCPDVLFVATNVYDDDGRLVKRDVDARRRFVFGSSSAYTVHVPTNWVGSSVCHSSCDGLLCLYSIYKSSVCVLMNPATRWHRTFPPSNIQNLLLHRSKKRMFGSPTPKLGFGKDKLTGTYKPVFLTNSSGFGLDNVTTCEVFDFTTQLWRYVHPASPFTTNPHTDPVYLDGSLYWLTDCKEEPKVLSFDLHTETFHVICNAPFTHVLDPFSVTICVLDNRLCVSKKDWPTQDLWSFQYSNNYKTWKKMCSIHLTQISSWLGDPFSLLDEPQFPLSPIAILDKHKLLLQGGDYGGAIFTLDLLTNSYHLLFKPTYSPISVCYSQSLFSV